MGSVDSLPWAAGVAVAATLAIWGRSASRIWVHWIFKPVTVAIVLVAVWSLAPTDTLKNFVAGALLFSLAGDVALMFDGRAFVLGLTSFLVALLVYAWGFSIGVGWWPGQLAYLALPALGATAVLAKLWPHVGRLRPAVALYVLAMVFMVWRMLARYGGVEVSLASWLWGAAGGLLFMTADSLLAYRRFVGKHLPYPLELGAYYVAQWCLASATWT